MERNESIIKKIKGLLAIADDSKNDEESQSAFVLAQKLMMKHDIQQSEVDTSDDRQEITEGQATTYKKLFWWERRLARIISENFKVRYYYNNKILYGESHTKRSITFFGFKSDVLLSKEMYILAYDAIKKYCERYVEEYYTNNYYEERSKAKTTEIKNSYMSGFLYGLEEKFNQQVEQMKQEYGLMVITPHEVSKAYEEMGISSTMKPAKMPTITEIQAYQKGYTEGEKIDYLKNTIDDDVEVF